MKNSLSIIIVEDSPDDAELIDLALRNGGLSVDWERVETAAELHNALANRRWDVIISDFSLPSFGAGSALEIVRKFDPDLPFIVVSGTIGEEMAVELMRFYNPHPVLVQLVTGSICGLFAIFSTCTHSVFVAIAARERMVMETLMAGLHLASAFIVVGE